MDCTFILQNEIHEKYLLKHLDETEIVQFEQHLKACENCQKRLEAEKNLIGGIQRTGREELRSEIQSQVAVLESTKSTPNWGFITRVAAVLVFVVLTTQIIYKTQIDVPDALMPTPAEDQLKSEGIDTIGESRYFEVQTQEPGKTEELDTPKPEIKHAKAGKIKPGNPAIELEKEEFLLNQTTGKKKQEMQIQTVEPAQLATVSTDEEELTLIESEKTDSTLNNPTGLAPTALAKRNEALTVEKEKQEGISFQILADQAKEEAQPQALSPLSKQSQARMKLYQTIGLEEKFDHDHTNDLVFHEGKSIRAHLVLDESIKPKEFPSSFRVDVLLQNDIQLGLVFYLPTFLFEFDREKIQITVNRDQTLAVLFDQKSYKIDLKQNPTEASLE